MLKTSKAKLLRLSVHGQNPTVYEYAEAREIWAEHEQTEKTNLFSRVGIGARGAKFGVYRPGDIPLHDAILHHGQHYFLTNINQTEPAAAEISAALVRVEGCSMKKSVVTGKDAYNRPVSEEREIMQFPGILTEKYLRWAQELPQATTQITYVLVTPKPVRLKVGDLVRVGETDIYNVRACHVLDDWKNEYEIVLEDDA